MQNITLKTVAYQLISLMNEFMYIYSLPVVPAWNFGSIFNGCAFFPLFAVSRSSCVVGDHVYQDGEVFEPDCGICECLDGKIECIDEFCGVSGKLFAHAIYSIL